MKRLFLIIILIVCTTALSMAQMIEPIPPKYLKHPLEVAFKEKSYQKLDEYLDRFDINKHSYEKQTDTGELVNQLLTQFLTDYLADLKKENTVPKPYVLLQPRVTVAWVNSLEDTKNNTYRISLNEGDFIFGGFSNYLPILDLASYQCFYDNSNFGTFKVVSLPSLSDINRFLHSFRFDLSHNRDFLVHRERADFLAQKMDLYETHETNNVFKYPKIKIRSLSYQYYVARIVFDKSMQNVCIQYAERGGAAEAIYCLKNKTWTRISRRWKLMG